MLARTNARGTASQAATYPLDEAPSPRQFEMVYYLLLQSKNNIMNPEERAHILLGAKPNSWVALSDDESKVVGTGSTYREAVDATRKNGEEDPLLIKTPEEWNE
jgi:hypothetical protein